MGKKTVTKGITKRYDRISFYLFLSLWIIGFAAFQVIPIFWGFTVSLTNRMAFSVTTKFVGFKNFLKVFQDTEVFYSIYTTFLYAVLNTAIQVCLGLVLALLLEKQSRGTQVFRVLYYLPYVIPVVATGWIFRIFLDKNIGFFNTLLVNLKIADGRISWLGEHPMLAVLFANFWRVGWSLLIFLGGLSTVPKELYDAADVDGTTYLQRVRVVTLPFLSPFIAFQLVISFIYGVQVFILPYILNSRPIRGAQVTMNTPPKETFFVLPKGYHLIFNEGRLAYGFALLWITFVIFMIFSLIYARLINKTAYSETDF